MSLEPSTVPGTVSGSMEMLLELSHWDTLSRGQQLKRPIVCDAGSTEWLSQVSLHLSPLACSCLWVSHRDICQAGGEAGIHEQRAGQNLTITALKEKTLNGHEVCYHTKFYTSSELHHWLNIDWTSCLIPLSLCFLTSNKKMIELGVRNLLVHANFALWNPKVSWRRWLQDGVCCIFNKGGNFVLISVTDSSFSKATTQQIMGPISVREPIDPGTQRAQPTTSLVWWCDGGKTT